MANLRLQEAYGELPRADKEYWWSHSAERQEVLNKFTGSEISRRRY